MTDLLKKLEALAKELTEVAHPGMGEMAVRKWAAESIRALIASAREEGKPLPPEEVIARLTFNSDGEEIGREMGKRIMYALRHDYQWLYTILNPAPAANTEGLRDWAEHGPGCAKYISFTETNISPRHSKIESEYDDNKRCTCGLDAALRGKGEI